LHPITRALIFAASYHDGQLSDDGTPYILHPIEVALLIPTDTPNRETAQVVALLHDTVEDTDATLRQIGGVFGREVRDAVDAVTHRGNEPHIDFVKRAAENTLGRVVKHADIIHNHLFRTPVEDPVRRERLHNKYEAALDYLEGRAT